jgi:hypothetical protein
VIEAEAENVIEAAELGLDAAVRYGESGEEFNLSKHSRPKDLQDVAAKLLDAEEQGRGEPE